MALWYYVCTFAIAYFKVRVDQSESILHNSGTSPLYSSDYCINSTIMSRVAVSDMEVKCDIGPDTGVVESAGTEGDYKEGKHGWECVGIEISTI
jgi:hypothetical protein